MSTTTVPITITCPDWCTNTAEWHANELSDLGGNCIHWHDGACVGDDTGLLDHGLAAPRECEPIDIHMTVTTCPEGIERASAVVLMNGQEMTIEQADQVGIALRELARVYRDWHEEQKR